MIHLEEDTIGLSLLIHDAKDEPQAYRLQARGGQFWLTREDTRDLYVVQKDVGGWSCSCKSYECRRRWNRDDCKHTRCLRLLEKFAALFKEMDNLQTTTIRSKMCVMKNIKNML